MNRSSFRDCVESLLDIKPAIRGAGHCNNQVTLRYHRQPVKGGGDGDNAVTASESGEPDHPHFMKGEAEDALAPVDLPEANVDTPNGESSPVR